MKVARILIVTTLLLLSLGTISSATLAQGNKGGNSEAARQCQQGGFKNWMDADGNTFKNAGQCTSYAAKGNALIPVGDDPMPPDDPPPPSVEANLSISFAGNRYSDYLNEEAPHLLITGSGLLPHSAVGIKYGDQDYVDGILGTDQNGTVEFYMPWTCDDEYSLVYVTAKDLNGTALVASTEVDC